MSEELNQLKHKTQGKKMTQAQRERQLRSIVHGNTKTENECVTREMVNAIGDQLLGK